MVFSFSVTPDEYQVMLHALMKTPLPFEVSMPLIAKLNSQMAAYQQGGGGQETSAVEAHTEAPKEEKPKK